MPTTNPSDLLLVALLFLGVLILWKVTVWYQAWNRRMRMPASVEEAREEFFDLLSERLGVATRAAELDKAIVDKWNEWPLEYRPALFGMLRHAQLLEESMYEEAVAQKVYPKRLFEGPLIPPSMTDTPTYPQLVPPAPSVAVDDEEEPERSPVENMFEWVNGQILSRTG